MIRWQCECGRAMAVKPEHAGKRVRCPDCETVQTVPDEQADDTLDHGVTENPRRAVPPAAAHEAYGDREPARKSGGAAWVWLSLAVVLLLAIGGVALWFFVLRDGGGGADGPGQLSAEAVENLKMVPADAPAFGTIALAKWWNGPHAKAYRESFDKFQSEFAGKTKSPLEIKPSQIERVTFALENRTGTPIYFITSSEPIDSNRMANTLGTSREITVNDKVIHVGKGNAVHFVNSKTFVLGNPSTLQNYFANPVTQNAYEDGPLQPAMASADKHLAVFSINTNAELFRKMVAEMQRRPNDPAARIALPMARAKNGLVTLDLSDELDLKMRLSYGNEADAKQALTAANDALQMGRGMLKGLQATVKEREAHAMVEILKLLDSILDSAQNNRNGNDVELAIHIDKKNFNQITKNWVAATKEATTKVRDAAQRIQAANNFKQLGLALFNYSDTYRNQLLPHAIYSKDGKPLLSWRVKLLLFVEADHLYRKFRLNEPWDSPHNIKLLSEMPSIYELPGHPAPKPGHTYVQVFTGPGTIFEGAKHRFNIAAIPDGSSNTIFTVEAAKAVPWTKPADIPYSPKIDPRTQIGKHYSRGTIIGLFDGSVRTLPGNLSEATMRNAITPADGNALGADW